MNFLSHHFFYANDDPWHNTGLILPDWSRSAKGRRKLEWMVHQEPAEGHSALWLGCQGHYEADTWFHQCHYFTETTLKIEKDLAKLQELGLFGEQRKWFLAHLLAEMLLDRLIMDRHTDALDHFYGDLRQVPYQDLERFLLQAGKEEMGRFPQAHKGFIESEFIRHYSRHEGLAESLNRVVQRTGQAALNKEEMLCLHAQMGNWLDFANQIKKPLQMERL
ncbi:MAG TPA: hypothetical protein DIW47_15410 [Bacteroidetes bacterium]|nr:hypothetical protein [Bacteroidota bacterium]